jgi:hypothetical protein
MNETGVQFFSDFDPRRHVTFRGSRATFHCRADQAERFLGVVKQWISEANRRYEVLKTRQIEEEQNRLQDRLEKEKTMERERQEILNKLKF